MVSIVTIILFSLYISSATAQWKVTLDTDPDDKLLNKSSLCKNSPGGQLSLYKFHRESGKCYKIGERGPCGDLMAFYAEDANYGTCDCNVHYTFGRALIYWPQRQRCYHAYSEGPCSPGLVLDFNHYQKPTCVRSTCPKNEGINTRSYWFSHRGRCVQAGAPGFCSSPAEVLFNPGDSYVPICYPMASIRANYGFVRSIKCLPGHRKDYYGKCAKYFGPSPDLGLKNY